MKLALIPPVQHVEYKDLLPIRFCIASEALRYPQYAEAFAADARRGYFTILDNGVFEEELIDDQALVDLCKYIRPNVLVAPDLLNADAEENWARASEFALKYYATLQTDDHATDLMFVPHTLPGETEKFEQIFQRFCTDQDTFNWFGVNRDVLNNAYSHITHTNDQELNRLFFGQHHTAQLITALREGLQFHCLGIGDRVDLIQYHWWADSMDTASFWWQGYLYNELTNGMLATRYNRPADYFTRNYGDLDDYQVGAIQHNAFQAQQYANLAGKLRKKVLGLPERV